MKKVFFMFSAAMAFTLISFDGTAGKGSATDSIAADSAAVAVATDGLQEGDKGPGLLQCDAFTIEVPEGWEVNTKKENELTVVAPSRELFNFVYDEYSNYPQERQFMMDINGMQDLGEKTFGDNTYATYLWKQSAGDVYKAILKIGDGEHGTIKVNPTNVETADNEMIAVIFPAVKMKK